MNSSKEEIEALRRIEELLAKNSNASAPNPETIDFVEKVTGPNKDEENIPVNEEAIKNAESQSKEVENQLVSINSTLESLLTEVQTLTLVLQNLTN